MTVAEAQQEVRSVFLGGGVGQAVAGTIWLLSAACGTWLGVQQGILALVVGGALIFPLTQLVLRLLGRPSSLGRDNPMNQLAPQLAFLVPLALPVIGAAALRNVGWFYPAFMVVVGAHYLPFVFLYGMWQYAVLAAVLLGAGVLLGLEAPHSFSLGGWLTGAVLLLFAVWVGSSREARAAIDASP